MPQSSDPYHTDPNASLIKSNENLTPEQQQFATVLGDALAKRWAVVNASTKPVVDSNPKNAGEDVG